MAFSFQPSGAASVDVAYGVDNTLNNFIIQNEDQTENIENLTIADQKGRTCQVIAYDKGETLSLTAIGPKTAPCAAGDVITLTSGAYSASSASSGNALTDSYVVQTVKRTCVYNDTAKWQIEAVSWKHATYTDKSESSL